MSTFLPMASSFFVDPDTDTVRYIIISLLYLVGAVGFVLSLKWMSDAKTARKGIFAGEIGFVLAIIGTLLLPVITTTGYIYIAIAVVLSIFLPIYVRAKTRDPSQKKTNAWLAFGLSWLGIFYMWITWSTFYQAQLWPYRTITPASEG